MKIIELHDDYAKVEINGNEYDFAIFQNSKELIIDLQFLKEFSNFDEMNQCDECIGGEVDSGEGDETVISRCGCQPKVII